MARTSRTVYAPILWYFGQPILLPMTEGRCELRINRGNCHDSACNEYFSYLQHKKEANSAALKSASQWENVRQATQAACNSISRMRIDAGSCPPPRLAQLLHLIHLSNSYPDLDRPHCTTWLRKYATFNNGSGGLSSSEITKVEQIYRAHPFYKVFQRIHQAWNLGVTRILLAWKQFTSRQYSLG